MRKGRTLLTILFLLPASVFYVVLFLLPAVQAFWYSLFDWRGFGEAKTYVGLGNFKELLTDHNFWLSMRMNVIVLIMGGVLTFSLAFLMTAMLSSGIKGKNFFRAMIFLPNVVATVALATLWGYIYNPRFGLINNFFKLLGLKTLGKTTWMAPDKAVWSVTVAMVWVWVGFYLVLLLAGADKIPVTLYEAARIEGANQVQIFARITIPLLWDVISVAIVLWGIGALKLFEFPYAIAGIVPPREIWTVGIYLYIMGFGKRDPVYRLGYATAIGVTMLLAVVVFVVVVRRFLYREAIEY